MPVVDVKAKCWLCGDAVAASDLTPVTLPQGVVLQVTLADGTVTTSVSDASPVPLCPNCVTATQDVLAYKNKPVVS